MTRASPAGTLFGVPILDEIEIVAYDPLWPERFREVRSQLAGGWNAATQASP